MRLKAIHGMKNGSVVFPAKIYIFGRRAVCYKRFIELREVGVSAWLRTQD